jgi:hypothetical protein
MNQELEKIALSLVHKHQKELSEETGIDSSIPESEIRKYVEEVIDVVNSEKKKDSSSLTEKR